MKLPPATRAAVVMTPPDPGAAVVICGPEHEPSLSGFRAAMRRRGIIASMTFDRGLQWPDAVGVATPESVLAAGGIVTWEFDRLVDALAAARRLRAGGVA